MFVFICYSSKVQSILGENISKALLDECIESAIFQAFFKRNASSPFVLKDVATGSHRKQGIFPFWTRLFAVIDSLLADEGANLHKGHRARQEGARPWYGRIRGLL